MQRWVGLGVIADNLINIGRARCGRDPALTRSFFYRPRTASSRGIIRHSKVDTLRVPARLPCVLVLPPDKFQKAIFAPESS